MKQTWHGSLQLSGRLGIDTARSVVYMSEPSVDRFVVDGLDEERQRLIAKVANVIAEKEIKNIPLVTFRPEELRFAGIQFVPTNIATTATGLVVTLEPAK